MRKLRLDEIVDRIVAKDPRYHRDAYHFVRAALSYTQKSVHKDARGEDKDVDRNVTGQQLLEGIREYALEQFGPMALTVLEEWGVRCCEDFGEIVFSRTDNGNCFLET